MGSPPFFAIKFLSPFGMKSHCTIINNILQVKFSQFPSWRIPFSIHRHHQQLRAARGLPQDELLRQCFRQLNAQPVQLGGYVLRHQASLMQGFFGHGKWKKHGKIMGKWGGKSLVFTWRITPRRKQLVRVWHPSYKWDNLSNQQWWYVLGCAS